jgi:dolichol-phosphate mannosyltransferase
MKRGFDSLKEERFGMDLNCSKLNRTSAGTVTSYRPPHWSAKPTASHEKAASNEKAASREKLVLVIPALCEAENLDPLLRCVRGVLESTAIAWEVIVVDDDSGDGSEEIVAAISREEPRVRLLVRRGERGLSGAILHGWRHAEATILGAMDADGQHPAELLPALIEAVVNGRRDLAIGSRYAKGGRCGWSPRRRLFSMAAILAARPLQSAWPSVRDPLSGFFLVRRPCVENVFFQTAGFKLLLEILVRGRIRSVEEIPFAFGRRSAGRSKVNAKVAWDYITLLARLYRARIARARAAEAASGD